MKGRRGGDDEIHKSYIKSASYHFFKKMTQRVLDWVLISSSSSFFGKTFIIKVL